MKKFFHIIIYLIAVLIFVFAIFYATKSIYISSAQKNFKNGKYETSTKQYTILLKLEPKNDLFKEGLANSLLKLPFTYENQKRICDFIEKYDGERYTYLLEQRLKKIHAELDTRIGPNYIDKAALNNEILRWEDDAFPLRVFISGGDEKDKKTVIKAFDYWAKATQNFFSFAYIDKENKADIKVNITGEAKTNCDGENCYYVAASTIPEIKNNVLQYMEMLIYTKDPYGATVSDKKLYKTTLHEIGHALGIMGHSENTEDLMYSSRQHNGDEYFSEHRSELSSNDINTFNYLYMIVPHISNVPKDKRIKQNKIYPSVILGTSRQIKQRDIENALKYIQNAPNLAIGYMDLGNAYVQAEMYTKALDSYKQAFDLSVDKQERYSIVYNMATTCIKMKDRKKALYYAEYAKKINPTDEINNLIHDIKYPLSLSRPEY